MRPWLQLVRWPNLLIVALTMGILQFQLLLPAFQQHSLAPTLSSFQFCLLVVMTVIATAAGYVVNDWFDYPIDTINKPNKVIINKSITWRKAKQFYIVLVVMGAFIGSYLSGRTGLWGICILYNLVTVTLFLYARYLKRKFLIGNVVVALLCSFVTLLVWYINLDEIVLLEKEHFTKAIYLRLLLTAYIGFSILITMFREIVKDIEDMEGDKMQFAETIPIVAGVKVAKFIAGAFGVALLAGLLLTKAALTEYPIINGVQLIGFVLFALICSSLILLIKAETKQDFSRVSLALKGCMAVGLVLLFLL